MKAKGAARKNQKFLYPQHSEPTLLDPAVSYAADKMSGGRRVKIYNIPDRLCFSVLDEPLTAVEFAEPRPRPGSQ